MTEKEFETVINGFLEAALFAGYDENMKPLNEGFTIYDFHIDSIVKANSILEKFVNAIVEKGINLETILDETGNDFQNFGIDIFFTITGQGSGFWDGDWEPYGDQLTEIIESLGFYIEVAFISGEKVVIE